MGTLIGAILGFAASTIPHVISFSRAWMDYTFAQRAKQLDLNAVTQCGFQIHPAPVATTTFASPAEPIAADTTEAGCPEGFWDHVRASVRPVLTYAFFALFALIKLVALYYVISIEHLSMAQALPLIWDAETSSLFAAIIAFWFGTRTIARYAPMYEKTSIPSSGTITDPTMRVKVSDGTVETR